MKIRKILTRIGVVLLAVVAAVLLVRAVLNFTEGRALARILADLKAKGVPLAALELAPPCPDADNAARLWKAAASLLEAEGSDRERLGRAFQDLAASKPPGAEDRAEIEALISRNRKALDLVYEMADRPCFLYRDSEAALQDAMVPDALKMIIAARLVGFDALFRADGGDVPGALERIRDGLASVSKTAQEGTLIAYLVSVAETRMMLKFLEAICQGRNIADADLARLVAGLESGPWRERLAEAIRGDRVFSLEWGMEAVRGRFRDPADQNVKRRIFYWLLRPVIKAEVRWQLARLTSWEKIARDPYFEQRARLASDPEFSEAVPWYFELTGFLAGTFDTVFLKTGQLEAIMVVDRTALACRLYKSRSGRYPETMDELVPGLLTEVPLDPFTGKPLVYRREGEGFIVYSLGSNEKDDGGRSTYAITRLVMPKDDDWSWREDR
jgi:hypothetical protein